MLHTHEQLPWPPPSCSTPRRRTCTALHRLHEPFGMCSDHTWLGLLALTAGKNASIARAVAGRGAAWDFGAAGADGLVAAERALRLPRVSAEAGTGTAAAASKHAGGCDGDAASTAGCAAQSWACDDVHALDGWSSAAAGSSGAAATQPAPHGCVALRPAMISAVSPVETRERTKVNQEAGHTIIVVEASISI